MSETLDVRAKALLRRLITKSNKSYSLVSVIDELVKLKDSNVSPNLMETLNDIFEAEPAAHKLFKEKFPLYLRSSRPIDCVRRILVEYTAKSVNRIPKTTGHQKPSICADAIPEERELSADASHTANKSRSVSLNVEKMPIAVEPRKAVSMNGSQTPVTPQDVPDIMKKVCKAASDGLSRSAKNSPMSGSSSSDGHGRGSATHKPTAVMAQIEASALMPDTVRLHSQRYFSRKACEAVMTNVEDMANCVGLLYVQQEQLIIDDLLYCFIGIAG